MVWEVYSDLVYTSGPHFMLNDDVIPSTSYTPSAPKLGVRAARIVCSLDTFRPYTELPYGAKGILGLTNSSTSFVNSLVSSQKIPFKVALCLPSKHDGTDYGAAYIGGGPYSLLPNEKDVTGLLVSTPLTLFELHGLDSMSYHIDVKSIEVNGKRIFSFNQEIFKYWKGARISSNLIPYGLLDTSIYKPLVKAFARKAKKRNAVAPFTDCFSYKSFGGKSMLGKEIPVISLVLGGGSKWDIYGSNSLVKVNKNFVCLAFIDAGVGVRFPVEIGGYQVEDNLIEFDLEASKFSFSSSLLLHNTSCSRPL